MARGFNQVVLMGNLTRDPELRSTPSGQNVVSFSLAVNRSYKDRDGNLVDAVDFVDCVAWGPLAERVSQYCQKGKQVLVNGRLQSRSWEDQQGQKRSKLEVLAADVTFLGSTAGGAGVSAPDFEADAPAPKTAKAPAKMSGDPVPELDDAPIDLSEIPF